MDTHVLVSTNLLVYGFNRNTSIVNTTRRRQRSRANALQLSKKKQRHAYELWQANQIKIWKGMNEQALVEENNLKNPPQRVDN